MQHNAAMQAASQVRARGCSPPTASIISSYTKSATPAHGTFYHSPGAFRDLFSKIERSSQRVLKGNWVFHKPVFIAIAGSLLSLEVRGYETAPQAGLGCRPEAIEEGLAEALRVVAIIALEHLHIPNSFRNQAPRGFVSNNPPLRGGWVG